MAKLRWPRYRLNEGDRLSRLEDILRQSVAALRAHKLRATLTIVGLTMGVATLITVMTIVQGANVYVEQKIANLGTDVFQIAKTPFAVTDFDLVVKALRFKRIEWDDVRAVSDRCQACQMVGASATTSVQCAIATRSFRTSTSSDTPPTWRTSTRVPSTSAATSASRKTSR